MTAHLRYDMSCDGEGCSATFTIGSRQATPMREEAAKLGWSWRPKRVSRHGPALSIDLCPECTRRADESALYDSALYPEGG